MVCYRTLCITPRLWSKLIRFSSFSISNEMCSKKYGLLIYEHEKAALIVFQAEKLPSKIPYPKQPWQERGKVRFL